MGLFHQFIPVSQVTATNIRNFMDTNGLDNKGFAALAGVDPSTVKRIVTDPRCEIRSDTRQKLTRAIGCTWNQLREPNFIPVPVAPLGDLAPLREPAVSVPSVPAPPREPEVVLAFPTCRRAPLALWLLNSLRAWRECFTWRAAFGSLSDWLCAAFSPRPPRLTQARLAPLHDYLEVWHDGESDPEVPHA